MIILCTHLSKDNYYKATYGGSRHRPRRYRRGLRVTFQQRLQEWSRPLVLYEVIPPPHNAPREEVADTAAFIRALLSDHPIDAINVPDVRNEDRNGNRKASFMKKRDPRQFALTLQDVFGGDVDLIVNRVTVHEQEAEQYDWLKTTYSSFGIPNVVLVGGESSDVDYPGPGVTRTAEIAGEVAEALDVEATLGGITIPTRRRERLDEPERMLHKMRHGIGFFTSQVIYEARASCQLLRDYDAACREAGVDPAPVFLSFAPIAGRKDLEFLEWLGVEVPPACQEWILATHARPLDRSVRVAEHALREVLAYVHRRDIQVPVGINVEHVMRYNFEPSEVLLDRLSSLLDWHAIERRLDT